MYVSDSLMTGPLLLPISWPLQTLGDFGHFTGTSALIWDLQILFIVVHTDNISYKMKIKCGTILQIKLLK